MSESNNINSPEFVQGQIAYLTEVASGLLRDKWERKGNVRDTIEKAKKQNALPTGGLTAVVRDGWVYQQQQLIEKLISGYNSTIIFTDEEPISKD